jgi:hypothetical protein
MPKDLDNKGVEIAEPAFLRVTTPPEKTNKAIRVVLLISFPSIIYE